MKQVFGTTLPEGSLQAACKIVAKLKQDLYVPVNNNPGSETPDEREFAQLESRAKNITFQRVQKITASLGWGNPDAETLQAALTRVQDSQRQTLLSPKSHAGQTVSFHASILAVPQLDSWKLQPLETDWETVQATLGQPIDSFYSAIAGGEALVEDTSVRPKNVAPKFQMRAAA